MKKKRKHMLNDFIAFAAVVVRFGYNMAVMSVKDNKSIRSSLMTSYVRPKNFL